MTEQETTAIVAAIRSWALNHRTPDIPVLEIGDLVPTLPVGGGGLSPRQIYNEIREESEIGRWILRVVDAGIERTSFEEVLRGFRVGL